MHGRCHRLIPMSNWLIKHARLVNEGREWEADLRIVGERIETIGSGLVARAGEQVLDAHGRWLLPGMIDDQVHFREPGFPHKGDLASESIAAVAGGVTSIMDMPNTRPPTLDAAALEDKYQRAAGRCRANYGFYLGASNDNIAAIRALDPRTAPGIKVFMGASTGNMLVDDPTTLDLIFRDAPVPIITHCEDTPMIEQAQAEARARLGDAVPVWMHPEIRSRQACLKSSTLAVSLAKKHGTRLHVLHISTADELALFEAGPLLDKNGRRRKHITAETCIHFLHFAREDYARLGNLIKCNPSIKDAADRDALIAAIGHDLIDILATDHAPHTLEEKQQPYLTAPSGLPLVQEVLIAALELVRAGKFSLPKLVQKVAHAPAQLFDVAERGFLREGYFADLVLVDPNAPHRIEREGVLSRCGWSPFEGMRFSSRVQATFVNGELVWDGQRLIGDPNGQRLGFAR